MPHASRISAKCRKISEAKNDPGTFPPVHSIRRDWCNRSSYRLLRSLVPSRSSQIWMLQLRAIALSRVDFPLPFSPMKKVTGSGKFHHIGLLENFQVKRVTVSCREGIVEQVERLNMHCCVIFFPFGLYTFYYGILPVSPGIQRVNPKPDTGYGGRTAHTS